MSKKKVVDTAVTPTYSLVSVGIGTGGNPPVASGMCDPGLIPLHGKVSGRESKYKRVRRHRWWKVKKSKPRILKDLTKDG